jgi:hypothetical protein
MKIENTPGPGTYRIQLKPGGPDFVSKFRSSMPQSFTHSPRKESATLTPKRKKFFYCSDSRARLL